MQQFQQIIALPLGLGLATVAFAAPFAVLALAGALREARRHARWLEATRTNDARREVFIDALKIEAAETAVCGEPIDGAGLLQMLCDHDLLTEEDEDKLIAAARESAMAKGLEPLPLPNGFNRTIDDEIPF